MKALLERVNKTEMKKKIEVGQTVWVLPIGNAARRGQELDEASVTKVGNKFFELSSWYRGRFYLDTLFQDGKGYSANYRVYLSKEDYEAEREYEVLLTRVKDYFGHYNQKKPTLEQLRAIDKILNPEA